VIELITLVLARILPPPDGLTTFVREISPYVGIAAVGVLCWRASSTWDRTSYLTRALAVCLGVGILISAYGSTRALATGLPPLWDTIWLIFLYRTAILLFGLAWPWHMRHDMKTNVNPNVRGDDH